MKRRMSSFRPSWRSISVIEGGLRVEAEQHVVALAVLLDPVGQAAQAPVFALLDRAALGFELGGDPVGDAFDLLLRDVVACDQHAFI